MLEKEQGRQHSRFSEGEGIIRGEERKYMGKELIGHTRPVAHWL